MSDQKNAGVIFRLSPWVFGATHVRDYSRIAVGRDAAQADRALSIIDFAGDAIEGLGVTRSQTERTWSVRRGGQFVVGMACAGELIAKRSVNDKAGRPLFYFLGYTCASGTPGFFLPMASVLFDVLFRQYVEPNLDAKQRGALPIEDEITCAVEVSGAVGRYVIKCSSWTGADSAGVVAERELYPSVAGQTCLSTQSDRVRVFPFIDAARNSVHQVVWADAFKAGSDTSVCVGYSRQDRLTRTPFLNVTLPHIVDLYEKLKTNRPPLAPPPPPAIPAAQHATGGRDGQASAEDRQKQDILARIVAVLNCLSLGSLRKVLRLIERLQKRDSKPPQDDREVEARETSHGSGGTAAAYRARIEASEQIAVTGEGCLKAISSPPPDRTTSDGPHPIDPGASKSNDEQIEDQHKTHIDRFG